MKTLQYYIENEYKGVLAFVSKDKEYAKRHKLFVKIGNLQTNIISQLFIPYVLLRDNKVLSHDCFYMDTYLNVRPINKNESMRFAKELNLL